MGLNIKNDETCRLTSELTRLTDATMTGAMPSAEASWSGTALAPLGGTARYSGDAAGRIARHGKDGGAFTADAELVADFGLGVGLPRRRRRIARVSCRRA